MELLSLFIKPLILVNSLRLSDISKLTIISSDNGLSPKRRQAIICTNAWILLIATSGTNLVNSEVKFYIFIQENAFENVFCEMAAILSLPQCVKVAYGMLQDFVTIIIISIRSRTDGCSPFTFQQICALFVLHQLVRFTRVLAHNVVSHTQVVTNHSLCSVVDQWATQ